MTRRPDVARELAKLKGFQRTTVEYAFDRLYRAHKSSHRFLVADEVGLGKTLVAPAPELLVDWVAFEGYRRLEPQNGRLRWLEQWLDSTGVWKLLWLPPTLPYWGSWPGRLGTCQRAR